MPEPVSEDANWQYDYIDHYRLDEEIIKRFLSRKWGENYRYFVKARGFPASKPTTIG
jgi:hypothetical protein